jgi:hypothetical protein
MSVTSATHKILERMGLSVAAETYLTRDCGIDSFEEIAYVDGQDDVNTNVKGVTSLGGTVTIGTGAA